MRGLRGGNAECAEDAENAEERGDVDQYLVCDFWGNRRILSDPKQKLRYRTPKLGGMRRSKRSSTGAPLAMESQSRWPG